MGGTWWQWFWRWIVALETIVFVVGVLEVHSAVYALHGMGAWRLANIPDVLFIGTAGLVWVAAALIAKALLLVSVPMLVLVELVAWWRRARRRRVEASDRRAIQRAATQWERDDL